MTVFSATLRPLYLPLVLIAVGLPTRAAAQKGDTAVLGAVLPRGALLRDSYTRLTQDGVARAREFVGIDSTCVESLRERNRSSAPVDSALAEALGLKLLRPTQADSVLRQGRLFSYDLYSVSRPGFSIDSSQALIYVGYNCGPLCGSGELLLLQWVGRHWRIAGRVRLWVS
jgi:hypothetical protein